MTASAATFIAIALIAALALTGLERIQFGPWQRLRQQRYQNRLQARLARGEDRYFEELRELEAYPPTAAPPPRPFGRAFAYNLFVVGLMMALSIAFRQFTE